MRQLRVLTAAAEEAAEAVAHDEGEEPGPGEEFSDAIEDSLSLLTHEVVPLSAMSRRLTRLGIRRLVMRRFPYSIVVREAGDMLEVLAFAHHSRNPGYWLRRIST